MGEKITRSDVNIKYIFINPNENIAYTNNSAHNSGSIQSTRQPLQTVSNKRTKYDNNIANSTTNTYTNKTTTHTNNTNNSKLENNNTRTSTHNNTSNTASSIHTDTHKHHRHQQQQQQQQVDLHQQQAHDQLQLQQEINILKTRIQTYETNEHILHTNITSLTTDLNLTKTALKNGLATTNNPPSNLQIKLDKIEQSNHHLSEAISLLTKQLSDKDSTIHTLTNTLTTCKNDQKRVSDLIESSKNQHSILANEINEQKLLYIQYKANIEQDINALNNEIITYKSYIQTKEHIINDYTLQIATLIEENKAKNEQITQYTLDNAHLTSTVVSLEARVSELTGRLTGQEDGWTAERAALIQEQVELTGVLAEKDEVIRMLNAKIEQMKRTLEGVAETDGITCVRPDATLNELLPPDAGPHDDTMKGEEGEAAVKNDLSDKLASVHSSPPVEQVTSPTLDTKPLTEQHASAFLSSPLLITSPLLTSMPLVAIDGSPLL